MALLLFASTSDAQAQEWDEFEAADEEVETEASVEPPPAEEKEAVHEARPLIVVSSTGSARGTLLPAGVAIALIEAVAPEQECGRSATLQGGRFSVFLSAYELSDTAIFQLLATGDLATSVVQGSDPAEFDGAEESDLDLAVFTLSDESLIVAFDDLTPDSLALLGIQSEAPPPLIISGEITIGKETLPANNLVMITLVPGELCGQTGTAQGGLFSVAAAPGCEDGGRYLVALPIAQPKRLMRIWPMESP